jgi:hypothetical protein
MIVRTGRLLLIKEVISACTIHHLLVEEAPVWMLEEVAKWLRTFFWARKKQVSGGQCLVAWESICKPIRFGGLGIKDPRLQGLALRVRWEWLARMSASRAWQGLPMCKDPQACGVFWSLARITVGDGKMVRF